MQTPIDVSAYCERIGYQGPLTPTAGVLNDLQRHHLEHVPFENLDIHLGRPIRLELAALFDKIVVRRRGGFCYELNGLFAALLQALGFAVTYLSASDAHEDGSYGPDFDHLALLVHCPQDDPAIPWLVDVGWGDTFRSPLRLDMPGEQPQDGRVYWIETSPDGLGRLLWQRDSDGLVERQYRFTLQPRRFEAFAPMCVYHQTSPESPFTQRRLCTRATPEGRLTLGEEKLVITAHGQRQETPVVSEEVRRQMLRHHFGIDLAQG